MPSPIHTSMSEARNSVGMSQSELARRMVEAGFPNWSQTVVSRRERNEKTLRWHEAVVLRGIIGYPELPGDSNLDFLTIRDAEHFRLVRGFLEQLVEVAS